MPVLLSLALSLFACSEYAIDKPDEEVDLYQGLEPRDTDGDGIPDVNIDTDGDGIPDLNVDLDGDDVPELFIDIDGDGVPDLNLDPDFDGGPEINVDVNGDGVPDLNIDIDGDLAADLNVDLNGDGVPDQNIDVDGDLRPDENLLDTFVISEVSAVDFVFFGDTSGSMAEELTVMGSRIAEFSDRLATAGGDWQLIAVTGDQGCAIDAMFTPSTPNWASRFADALLQLPNNEDTDERGLETIARAVERTAPGQCNAGLLRPNALLHAIILSDENDESPGWESGDPEYWRQYADRLVDAKFGVQGLTKFSAIAGATPDGCEGADPGFGYVEAAYGTGGTFLSICDPWETQLDVLAQASVIQEQFALTVVPVPSTIQVQLDGSVLPIDFWTYDPTSNTVTLADGVAAIGQTITITYEAL